MATQTSAGSGTSYITYSSAVTNGYSALSIVMWIKSGSTGTDRGFFQTSATAIGGGQDQPCSLRYDLAGASGGGSNLIKGSIDSTSKTNDGYESASTVQTTNLQSVIMVWETTDRERLYLNAVEDTPAYAPATHTGTTVNATGVWMHRGAKDNADAWGGEVHELRIYSRRLSQTEISTIYNMKGQDTIRNGLVLRWHGDEGAPGVTVSSIFDRSGNGYTGTAGGSTNSPSYAEDLVHFRRRRAS